VRFLVCLDDLGGISVLAGVSCAAGGGLSMNSKCYRKYHERRTWFSASNECLSRGGSLAVFTDTGRPSDNNRLTDWLNASGADKTYWIGLIRSWWQTTDEGVHTTIFPRTSDDVCELEMIRVSLISVLAGVSCAGGELSMNSKCYRKYHESRTWFNASNECLSRGGSLAVFTDTGRPSDNNRLTDWLNASGADKTYWIGLVRSWWKTNGEGKL